MEYVIHPLVLAKIEIPMTLMTSRMHFEDRLWVPVVTWYIEGADKNILIDSGGSSEDISRYTTHPCEDIISFEEALAKVRLTPEKIDIIIQTHLMYDHCLNSEKCVNAKVVVQEDELRYAYSPHPLQLPQYGGRNGRELYKNLRLVTVRGDTKIMEGIELLHTPGHSPGGQSIAIDTSKGKAIITGFCCIGENFRPPEEQRADLPLVPSGIAPDLYKWFDSAMRVKGLADILLPLHDPDLFVTEVIPSPVEQP